MPDKISIQKQMYDELQDWKETHGDKRLSKGLSNSKKNEFIKDFWLIKDESGKIWISGAGRILLWVAFCSGGWKKHFSELERKKRTNCMLEVLKFRFREKLLGTNLLKGIDRYNARRLIGGENDKEIIL